MAAATVQHIACRVDNFAGYSDGVGTTCPLGNCRVSVPRKRTAAPMEDRINQTSLRQCQTILLERRNVLLLPLIVVRFRDVWTRGRRSLARVGQAAVALKGIRAWRRHVLYIGTDSLASSRSKPARVGSPE